MDTKSHSQIIIKLDMAQMIVIGALFIECCDHHINCYLSVKKLLRNQCFAEVPQMASKCLEGCSCHMLVETLPNYC